MDRNERCCEPGQSWLLLPQPNRFGGGVAAFLLSFNTLLALEKNGTVTTHELTEVIEQSLTKLKTLDVCRTLLESFDFTVA